MKFEDKYYRCSICDHSNLESDKRLDFIFDKATSEYHCTECAGAIQDTISDNEYEQYDWSKPNLPYWRRVTYSKVRPTLPVFSLDEVDEEELGDLRELDEDEPALS